MNKTRYLRQDDGFHRVFRFLSNNKTDRHDITEILLKEKVEDTNVVANQSRTHNAKRFVKELNPFT